MVQTFYDIINPLINCIPHKSLICKSTDKPWINTIVKHIINLRWAAYKKNNKILYHHYKAKLRNIIQKAKMNWFNKFATLGKSKVNGTSIWRYVKEIKHGSSACIYNQFKTTYGLNDADSSEAFAKAYVKHFRHDTSNNNKNKFDTVITDSLNHTVNQITADDVCTVINCLKTNKASGFDGIPIRLIIACNQQISAPLCAIFNTSLSTSRYPQVWKHSTVTAIGKKSRFNLECFRPISILSIFATIFEKVIMNKLISDNSIHDSISRQQFAFRKFSSCSCMLVQIQACINSYLNNTDCKHVSMCSFDIDKAFDQLPHSTIDTRLRNFFPHNFCSWYCDYLNNRTFSVKFGNHVSEPHAVLSGVPQGSVLSPLIFILCLDNIKIMSNSIRLFMYADDIVTLQAHDNCSNIEFEIMTTIRSVDEQIANLGMSLNANKTNIMIISKRNSVLAMSKITYKNNDIKLKDHLDILGVTFNSRFTMEDHINKIYKKARARLYIMRRLKSVADKGCLITVYNGLIRAIMEYCSILYLGATDNQLNKFRRVQRYAHYIICDINCICNILHNLDQRRTEQAIKLFYNATDNKSHILHSLIPDKLPNTKHYRMPFCKNARSQKLFIPYITMLVNSKME